jgi:hypothetical protein
MLDAQTQFVELDGVVHQMSEPPRSCGYLSNLLPVLF